MSITTQTCETFDTIVIGGGMAGVSIAYELANHQSVAILEKESTLAYHTTGRSAAAFLESYGNETIRILTSASRGFFTDPRGFEGPLATPLRLMVVAGEPEVDGLRALHRKVSERGDNIELVDGSLAEELNPILRPGYASLAMVDSGALKLDVHAIHQGYLRGFRQRGGVVVKASGVVGAQREKSTWTLHDRTGLVFRASMVINAAGAWCDEVALALGARAVGISPLRRTAFMVSAPRGTLTDGLPITMEASERFYFKPDGAQFLCSPADETMQKPGDARPDDVEIARAIEMINEATTLQIRSVNSAWAGLRNFTTDRTPVVGFDPHLEGLFWYVGQGGYGIQLAPALARLGAALATGAGLPADLAAMGLSEKAVARDRSSIVEAVPHH